MTRTRTKRAAMLTGTGIALALVALYLDNITITSGDYAPVLTAALLIGAASALFLTAAFALGRTPVRVIAAAGLAATAWTMIDAASRLTS